MTKLGVSIAEHKKTQNCHFDQRRSHITVIAQTLCNYSLSFKYKKPLQIFKNMKGLNDKVKLSK